jgi:NAD(P)-dependent dehydrogenase (short-subunit alcohol dehydrogenase family)
MPALDGRTAIVTGANSGLGYETALELARHGADVTMLARDEGRGTAARARLLAAAPAARVTLAVADLADLSAVRSFAGGWLAGGAPSTSW